jgi:hypothetical protein
MVIGTRSLRGFRSLDYPVEVAGRAYRGEGDGVVIGVLYRAKKFCDPGSIFMSNLRMPGLAETLNIEFPIQDRPSRRDAACKNRQSATYRD